MELDEDGYAHIAIDLEFNGRHFSEVVVDLAHILERHSDHVNERIVMEVLVQMRGLEIHPPIITKDGAEFYAVHIQAHEFQGQGNCWYLVRFKIDDEVFVRTIHRDRNFQPKRIKDHEDEE